MRMRMSLLKGVAMLNGAQLSLPIGLIVLVLR